MSGPDAPVPELSVTERIAVRRERTAQLLADISESQEQRRLEGIESNLRLGKSFAEMAGVARQAGHRSLADEWSGYSDEYFEQARSAMTEEVALS